MASESTKTVVALSANVVIAAAKLAGGLVTGASAMLAEAAHSLADTMNEVFLLVSLRLGGRAPDEDAPVRLRQGALLLGVRGRDLHLRRRRVVLDLPGHVGDPERWG